MMGISYCTTCKGRLWQLAQTLPINILSTVVGEVDIVILDYHSPDNLKSYITDNYQKYILDGRLKYYRLLEDMPFHMSHAKNVVHRLATGNVLFNLDADNYIGGTVAELKNLKPRTILTMPPSTTLSDGRPGRIGYHSHDYHCLRGYDEDIIGMGADDSDFIKRAIDLHYDRVRSSEKSMPIQNTIKDKMEYVEDKGCIHKNLHWSRTVGMHARAVNVNGYGLATVLDIHDQIYNLEFN